MMTRSLLVLSVCGVAFSSAVAGFASRETVQPGAGAPKQERLLENPEPAKKGSDSPVEKKKIILTRLVTELQRSARSFVYLRSNGFTETDAEFEKLIAQNSAMFKSARIIRRDEQGNRQIPGWPGIALKDEFNPAGR